MSRLKCNLLNLPELCDWSLQFSVRGILGSVFLVPPENKTQMSDWLSFALPAGVFQDQSAESFHSCSEVIKAWIDEAGVGGGLWRRLRVSDIDSSREAAWFQNVILIPGALVPEKIISEQTQWITMRGSS